MASEKRFGYEWSVYNGLNPLYEEQFKQWLGPVTPAMLQGKRVLDAGCGMGRNSYWCLKWGAKEIVAFDNDDRTVHQAKSTLSEFPNARVEKQSIYTLSYENEFDVVFSIGVIQLLERPQEAVQKLIQALKPGGVLILWLYAREGNDLVLKFIDPLRRRFTSKLPPPVLDYFTYVFSIPFYTYLKLIRPQSDYYQKLQLFPFRNIHLILFDHLLPTVAWYFTREESMQLIDGLEQKTAVYINGNSWTVTGTKATHTTSTLLPSGME